MFLQLDVDDILARSQQLALGHVPVVLEDDIGWGLTVVAGIAGGMKATRETSLDEAPKVMLPNSQEHGEPSCEQQ